MQTDSTQHAAMTDTFKATERMLWYMANKVGHKFGVEADELFGEAMLAWMDAYKAYKPTEGGTFAGYLSLCVRNRLYNFCKRFNRVGAAHLEAEGWAMVRDNGTGDLPELDGDAAVVLGLVTCPPPAVAAEAAAKGGEARNVRSTVKAYLRREMGWEASRVADAFDTVRRAL